MKEQEVNTALMHALRRAKCSTKTCIISVPNRHVLTLLTHFTALLDVRLINVDPELCALVKNLLQLNPQLVRLDLSFHAVDRIEVEMNTVYHQLALLKNIQHLHLMMTIGMSSFEFSELHPSSLISLTLNVSFISKSTLLTVLESVSQLSYLCLLFCEDSIDDEFLNLLRYLLPDLKTLCLHGAFNVTRLGISNFALLALNCTDLKIIDCPRVGTMFLQDENWRNVLESPMLYETFVSGFGMNFTRMNQVI
jgi:hypothetical protein